MKIKIVEPGWAGFSGFLGHVLFENGISADEVSTADARQMASIVQVENVDAQGEPASMAELILKTHANNMPGASAQLVSEVPPAPPAAPVEYTAESLAALVDAKGIKGLRALADPLGIKDNSVRDLIAKLLAHQAEQAAAAAKAAEAPKA